MSLKYQDNGNLIKGSHPVTWEEFVMEFGYNARRMDLIHGLEQLICDLADCGCTAIYIDGSFVTKKRNPADFDACWKHNEADVDLHKLKTKYPEIFTGSISAQKLIYKGEVRNAFDFADYDDCYLHYFQKDKGDKSPKGIIQLNIKPAADDKE